MGQQKGQGFFDGFTLAQDSHKQIALVRILDVKASWINVLLGEVKKQAVFINGSLGLQVIVTETNRSVPPFSSWIKPNPGKGSVVVFV
ncbi:hypothetical protein GCM10028817_22570 [Spirosoma pomorum]